MLQLKKGYKKMKVKYLDLKNKRVFISGGGSGIGASIVEHFCEQNSEVYFIDIDVKASNKLIKSIKKKKLKAPNFIECNILDVKKLQKIIKDIITKKGPIHCLVNSAANDDRHSTDQVDEKYWDNRMNINLRHYFFAAQSVYKDMKELGWGTIVNIGSFSWMIAQGGMPGYTTAKSAIMGLTRTLARDLGVYNVRVNCIVPGWIITERQKKLWLTDEIKKNQLERQCIKRMLVPEDISKAVLFFASEQSSGCTAQNYVIDGGIVN